MVTISAPIRLEPDDYFLSATNPTATADQRDLEALAIRCLELPVVQQARENAAMRWKTIVGRDMTAEMQLRFDELIDEYLFHYVLMATNSDANYPKVLGHLYGPPHEWFGMKVPGSRSSGGDGPDGHYTIMPIDPHARFELTGQRFANAPGDVPFTVTGNISLSMTLGSLDWQDVQFEPDGRFIVTVDPQPANGRPNHIQSHLEARYLFIRDCRSDWRQMPNAYRIKRLDPPTAPPQTIEQIARRGANFVVDDVPAMHWFMRIFAALEPNTVTAPFATGSVGGLVSQMISFSRVKLRDDEALVITAGSGAAPFRDIVVMDGWFRTFDYWNRTSNLNNSQSLPNTDGSTTYVISIQDPGVHNWLDTASFHDLLVVHRWQGLPRHAVPEGKPWVQSELVKLKDIDRALPTGMKRVTAEERQAQLAERLETFKLRYVDR